MKKTLIVLAGITAALFATSASAATYMYSDDEGSDTVIAEPLRPIPGRETNRQIIERFRNGKSAVEAAEVRLEQRLEDADGTTTGEIRVFRAEDGQVIEDRRIGILREVSGKPMLLRLSVQAGTSTMFGTGTPGMLVRTFAASGSRAIFLREIASTTGMPWFDHLRIFPPHMERVLSATSADGLPAQPGNMFFSFEEKKPPIRDFMDKVFNLFRRAAGDDR